MRMERPRSSRSRAPSRMSDFGQKLISIFTFGVAIRSTSGFIVVVVVVVVLTIKIWEHGNIGQQMIIMSR